MTNTLKSALIAGIAFAGMAGATPAAAQINGIATSNPAVAIASAKARGDAYRQINQTYAAQIQQIQTLQSEINNLQVSLDTNGDKQISQQEAQANPNVVQQIQQKEQQANTATQPIAMAQYYVIEQLLNDYGNARDQVIGAKGISLMLAPDAIQYGMDRADVTNEIADAINTRMPSVTIAVPAGWQPRRATVQMQQAVEQIIILAAARQQAAQQQAGQQPAQQPQGR